MHYYALFENSKEFGCAHIIEEKVDHGKIIDVKKFKIKKHESAKFLNKTHKIMFAQAKIIRELNNSKKPKILDIRLKIRNLNGVIKLK